MSKGGQEVPDHGPWGPGVSIGSQQRTFIDWTGLLSEMPLNMSRMDRNSIVGRGGQESPNS